MRLRKAFFAGASALALASLPMAANASVAQVHPLGCGGYSAVVLQDNSTAIEIEIVPQCVAQSPDDASIWEYVPISDGNQEIPYTLTYLKNNGVILTYDCSGTAPDTYHVIYSYGDTFADTFVSDDCGTFTEP